MAKKLGDIQQEVRQILQDEFVSGGELTWSDDELDLAIETILLEISQASPYETKLTAVSDGTKKIDLTAVDDLDLDDLMSVVKAEYLVDQDPEQFRNVSRFGDILTLEIDTAPTSGDDIYLYCREMHILDETTSTLNRLQESVLIKGVTAQAAISKSRKYIDAVNIGANTPVQLYNWGLARMNEYQRGLKGIASTKLFTKYGAG